MTVVQWVHVCPRCRRVSLRSALGQERPVCRHEYHAPEDCGLCGWCRHGLLYKYTPNEDIPASGAADLNTPWGLRS